MSVSLPERLRARWRDWQFQRRQSAVLPRPVPAAWADWQCAFPAVPARLPQARRRAECERARLCAQYPALSQWPAGLPDVISADSLTLLWLADGHLRQWMTPDWWTLQAGAPDAMLATLDVGTKNAAVMPGWATFLAAQAAQMSATALQLDAIELDAGRRYRDGRRRVDYGQALMTWCQSLLSATGASAAQTRYLAGDVLAHTGRHALITWLMPFVFARPHQRWGLPDRHFQPRAMAAHVLSLLAPDGLLLCVHLNELEADAQVAHWQSCELPHRLLSRAVVEDPWLYPGSRRVVTVLQRLA